MSSYLLVKVSEPIFSVSFIKKTCLASIHRLELFQQSRACKPTRLVHKSVWSHCLLKAAGLSEAVRLDAGAPS